MNTSFNFTAEAKQGLNDFIKNHELCRNDQRKEELRQIIESLFEDGDKEIDLQKLESILTKISQPKALSLDLKSGVMKYSKSKKSKLPVGKNSKLIAATPGDFGPWESFFYLFFTMVLPAAAIIIELLYHPFADSFFDPLPDFPHIILCSLPPLSNFISYWHLKQNKVFNPKMIYLQNAALAASFYYCLYFVPLSPLSALAIIFMGMGLLSLAPLFGFAGVYNLRKHYYRMHEIKASKLLHFFKALGLLFAFLLLSKIPTAITEYGIHKYAKATSHQEKSAAASLIRNLGSTEHILKKAQRGFGSGTAAVGDLPVNNSVSDKLLNQLYFQVTGKSPKKIERKNGSGLLGRSRFNWDPDVGDQEIGTKQEQLFLISSQFDSKLDADPAIAYSEWIMEFENLHERQSREARMEIILPDQAVISRLTLWVNGEEREAAFAKSSKVKSAYQKIVRQRRDPVLVTWSAKNRIFVQCFPVLAQKRMKIRIGITSPMPLSQDKKHAYFYPPQILASNFHLAPNLDHQVWLESKQNMTSAHLPELKLEKSAKNSYSLRGTLSQEQMAHHFRIELPRRDINEFWGLDHHDESRLISSKLSYGSPFSREKFLVLIDGSHSMAKEKEALAPTIKKLIDHKNFEVFIAGTELTKVQALSDYEDYDFEGGRDNLYALDQIIELATHEHSIIWIHGPQPYLLSSSNKLNQYQKRRGLVPILNFQFNSGANKILQEIKKSPHYSNLAASNRAELIDLFELMLNPSEWPQFKRTFIDADSFTKTDHQASSHLARLMISDEVYSAYFSDAKNLDVVAQTAAKYQLVTPLSGAVVLETQAQYDAAGLEAVDPSSVPTVPEPETWALIIILSLFLIYYLSKEKHKLLANK
ncbi:VIT domain-containing protein [Lentisphaera profundi]|uniref:VIT domain-containing protein n=1 Tax=Lentisphaera profundi TaxID=1658616 RepID=A0ABY7W101_9BACT|nr:VIT domain-containing protein [Lentisphaera profundi]WDE98664.1 VIT domain-containing protein [Lentisphaera profundi]